MRVDPPLKTTPIRNILKGQAIATAVIALLGGLFGGGHAALSAVLGGAVNLSATVVYAFVLGLGLARRGPTGVGRGLAAMFRAEAAKLLVIVVQLWLVLTQYRDLAAAAFFAAFIVTVLMASLAFFARDEKTKD